VCSNDANTRRLDEQPVGMIFFTYSEPSTDSQRPEKQIKASYLVSCVTRVMSEAQTIPTLPPIVVAFIAGIKPSFNVLVVCSVWLGVSIPLLFILFYFSSGDSRKKPLFFFNAVSILLGITMGFMNIVILVRNFQRTMINNLQW